MRSVFCLVTASLLTVVLAASALAQSGYPDHAVRAIVPTSPGATTDVLARGIGQSLSQAWGQPVVIENRPGADEMLGDELVAKAAPDGYTLGVISNGGITAAPLLHREVHYDPEKDFTPIFNLGEITPVMVVPANSSVHSVQDLIALAKQKPGALNYGSFGVGSYAHVAMEDFKQRTGVQMTHIPYRGATPAYQALIRGEVEVMIANLSGAEAQEKGGTVRIIAAASAHRIKARPDLPTVAESGVPGFSTTAWWGVFGPAKLPTDVVDKIRTDIAHALDTPEMEKIYQANTMERDDMTPEQFSAFIRTDSENWARQLKAAGIKPE
jgi:tripartite-type tricarboxylate transporter receptor subunit TctC